MSEDPHRSATPPPALDDARLMFSFAHDLRTHLRTVRINLQLVQRGGAAATLPDDDQRMLQEAVNAAGQIDSLMNAMAAFCDVSSEDATTRMNLDLLVRGLLLERKAALAEGGAAMEVQNIVTAPVPVSLKSVLKELLTNACRFRDPSRPLRIRIESQETADNGLEVFVADNGLGVDSPYLEKIFEPFQRLHSRDMFPGHGLGLSTCRRIAAVWGGTVAAITGDGGLRVRVTVPAR